MWWWSLFLVAGADEPCAASSDPGVVHVVRYGRACVGPLCIDGAGPAQDAVCRTAVEQTADQVTFEVEGVAVGTHGQVLVRLTVDRTDTTPWVRTETTWRAGDGWTRLSAGKALELERRRGSDADVRWHSLGWTGRAVVPWDHLTSVFAASPPSDVRLVAPGLATLAANTEVRNGSGQLLATSPNRDEVVTLLDERRGVVRVDLPGVVVQGTVPTDRLVPGPEAASAEHAGGLRGGFVDKAGRLGDLRTHLVPSGTEVRLEDGEVVGYVARAFFVDAVASELTPVHVWTTWGTYPLAVRTADLTEAPATRTRQALATLAATEAWYRPDTWCEAETWTPDGPFHGKLGDIKLKWTYLEPAGATLEERVSVNAGHGNTFAVDPEAAQLGPVTWYASKRACRKHTR
jgi:hypothetical protein